MAAQTKLFTQTKDYYADLVDQLERATDRISMSYLTFDDGIWARRIADVLRRKAAAGVRVRLMVDEIGMATDKLCVQPCFSLAIAWPRPPMPAWLARQEPNKPAQCEASSTAIRSAPAR